MHPASCVRWGSDMCRSRNIVQYNLGSGRVTQCISWGERARAHLTTCTSTLYYPNGFLQTHAVMFPDCLFCNTYQPLITVVSCNSVSLPAWASYLIDNANKNNFQYGHTGGSHRPKKTKHLDPTELTGVITCTSAKRRISVHRRPAHESDNDPPGFNHL